MKIWLLFSFCLLAFSTSSSLAQFEKAAVAVFYDKLFPYYMGNSAVMAKDVINWLKEFGIDAQLITANELADSKAFNFERFKVLVHIYGNSFPKEAAENIRKFHQSGGCIISPGVPFCHPCLATGVANWRFEVRSGDEGIRDDTENHSGQASVKIVKKVPSDWIGISSDRIPAEPGAIYTLAGWVKTAGEVGKETEKMKDHLFLRFWDKSGDFKGQDGPTLPPEASQWTFISKEIQVPEGIENLDVSLQLWASQGTAWLDDVILFKGRLKELPKNAQTPGNLVANPGFEIVSGPWKDLGHDSSWFSHEKIGTGDFYEPPRDIELTLKYWAKDDPLGLDIIPWSKIKGWFQTINPDSLPKEDELISLVGFDIRGKLYPTTGIIKHRCPQFNGALDLWVGTQTLSRQDYETWLFNKEVIVRGVAYFLKEKGIIPEAKFAEIKKLAKKSFKLPKPIENLEIITERKPFKGVFPKSNKPSKNLWVFDARKMPKDIRLALISLQGIVNRKKPRIYYIFDSIDEKWLQWMKQRGHTGEENKVDNPWELFNNFKSELKGTIITDPEFPASINIATMLSGVKDALIVSPELSKQFDLPVLDDLRGKWKKDVEAYRWAFENLWQNMNHHVLCCLYPPFERLRDYLIEFKIFTFWLSGALDGQEPYASPMEEVRLMEELFSKMPANIPIMGYSWGGEGIGIGEGPGVTLFAEFGKYLVGSIDLANMSVHSGTKVEKFKQKEIKFRDLQKDKIYISFIISDGDNLPVLYLTHQRGLWDDPARGALPLGWTISPAAYDIMPDIMENYYSEAYEADYFLAAVSGVGYTYPDVYGKRYRERAKVFDGFLAQTKEYMNKMDLKAAWIMGITDDKLIRRYAEIIPDMLAIFPDYGRRGDMTYERANYFVAQKVPVFHALTGWSPEAIGERAVKRMVEEIRNFTPKERPAFMHIFVLNWHFRPSMLKQVAQELGDQYIVLRPDELAFLYQQANQP